MRTTIVRQLFWTLTLLCLTLPLCDADEPFEIVPAPGKVVIDGKLDDWDLSGAYGPVSFDAEYLGRNDATFHGMYDADNLYLAFHVHDPDPLVNKGTVEDGNYWLGDSIEVRLSVNPKDGVPPPQDSPSVRHLAMWFNHERQKVQQYIKATMKYAKWPDTGMQVAFHKWEDGTGWDCEVAVPWSTLSPDVRPQPGDYIGWCMAVLFGNATGTQHFRKVNVMSGDINYQQTSEWHRPGAHLSPVGNLPPNPKTRTQPREEGAVTPAVATVSYTLPRAGKVSLAIYRTKPAEGGKSELQLVRSLLFHEPQEAGAHQIPWDGYDDDGNPLPPGTYTWKLAVGDGVTATYVMGLLNGGSPKYPTPDGKGGWGGIWGNVVATAADRSGVYLLWEMEEGQGALVKITPDGRVLWKQHIPYELSGFQSCLATDGESVVLACTKGLWRVKASTGEYWPFSADKPFLHLDPPEEIASLSEAAKTRAEKEACHEQIRNMVPEARRLPFLTNQAIHHISGIALAKGKIYLSRLYHNKVEMYDLQSLAKLREVTVERPFGLAVDRGHLFVASGAQILRFVAESLQPQGAAVNENLVGPYGVAVDRWGNIWVTDLGESQQVKKFSPDGKLIAALGRKGGRPMEGGQFIKEDFLHPTGICVEPTTQQVFLGEDVAPKRVIALDTAGGFVRDWLGPYYWGLAQFAVDVKRDPLQFYAFSGGSAMRFDLDLKNGTATLDAVWPYLYAPGNLEEGKPLPIYDCRRVSLNYRKEKAVSQPSKAGSKSRQRGKVTANSSDNPQAYLCIGCGNASFFQVDGYRLRPCALAAPVPYYGNVGPFKWTDGYRAVVWRDANGDGKVQLNSSEVTAYKELPAPVPGMYFGPYIDEDFNIYWAGASIVRLPCQGFDARGNPVYDFSKLEIICEKLPVESDETAVRLDEAGNVYFSRERFYNPQRDKGKYPEPKGLDWAGRNTNADVCKMNPKGELVWRVLRKAEHFRRPGEVYALRGGIGGRAKGCIFVDDCSASQTYVIDEDGLVLDTLLEDVMRGPTPSPYTLYVEHFTSYWFTDPRTNDLYFVTGAEDVRLFRVTGIESYQRMTGNVSFTQPPKPRATAAGLTKERVAYAARFAKPPLIDGDLSEWTNISKQTMAVDKEGAESSAQFQIGYDKENLYAAFHVNDASPMVNSANVLSTCFKFGDSLDLYLACDPNADPQRKEPAVGDVRLLLTKYQGKPLVLAYRARVPGTTQPTVFTSPVNRFVCDVVEALPDAELAFAIDQDNKGYTAEVRVPLAQLKPLTPAPGVRIGFDAGVTFSDRQGQFNAAKVYWTGREAMVRDIPTEASFNQDQWGRLEFRD